jgi:acyl transferase domain-containing protein
MLRTTTDSDGQPFNIPAVEPGVAIIGMAGRFPGAENLSQYWDLLCSGRTAIGDIPADRWNPERFYDSDPQKPGTSYVRKGGFLRAPLDQFDAAFFGISPREAMWMDPQQRLLLEVAWEAFEDAGIPPDTLAGSSTGVFVGGFTLDSLILQMSTHNRRRINSNSATGSSMTMLSNRLSYCFDFRGPSMSVDTACSASLMALHLACQSLRNGECTLALAGGVNVMLVPEYWITMSKGQFLARDGFSKTFDETADGYARGEGAGLVLLKPLQQALRDKDQIYAIVRGTAVNHDGHTNGIAAPNPAAQEALIRKVYSQAKVPLDQVRYVEAHGTGTAVGDPIEASVLGKTFGAGRMERERCIVGSAKAAIGHLEAAAGIAGLTKAALCLHYGEIPPQANLKNPNSKIPFDALGLRLPGRKEPMPQMEGPVYVGVNSFGYGGSNAHVILQQAPR